MRRLHVGHVLIGVVQLGAPESHHARDVLRMEINDRVELFDSVGNVGSGVIISLNPFVAVELTDIKASSASSLQLIVASAVPKGDRADWLVEKLSEIGTLRWIPLQTARSVVHPEGTSKLDRWKRIATESAKQSRRSGVMEITALTSLSTLISQSTTGLYLSTSSGSQPILQALPRIIASIHLYIGPEGGWTSEEETQMQEHGLTPASLGETILRIETAAVVAAAIAGAYKMGQ